MYCIDLWKQPISFGEVYKSFGNSLLQSLMKQQAAFQITVVNACGHVK